MSTSESSFLPFRISVSESVPDRPSIMICSPLNSSIGGISRWTELISRHFNIQSAEHENPPFSIEIFPMNNLAGTHEFNIIIRSICGIFSYFCFITAFLIRFLFHKLPDAVHICSSGSLGLLRDIALIQICRTFKVPIALHFHFGRIPDLMRKDGWEWRLLKSASLKATMVLVLDRRSLETLAKIGANVHQTNNPAPKRLPESEKNPVFPTRRKLFFVGRLTKLKGAYDFIKACAPLDDVAMHMYGRVSLSMRKRLLKEFHTIKGENSTLKIHGVVDRERIFSDMRDGILINPSHTEAFPNVILEAMTRGIPIIATDTGAVAEILNADDSFGHTGICVGIGDIKALRMEVTGIFNNLPKIKDMILRGQKKAETLYSPHRVAKDLCELWREII